MAGGLCGGADRGRQRDAAASRELLIHAAGEKTAVYGQDLAVDEA